MTTPDQDFIRACARRTNELHRAADRDFHRTLFTFALLGAILVGLTFAGIALGWQPGNGVQPKTQMEVSK